MDVIIRPATLDDLKDVQRLNLLLFKKEHKEYDRLLNLKWTFGEDGTKYYTNLISGDSGCVFIALVDGKIIGYLAGTLKKAEVCRNLPITAELENTLVIEKYRSKGIGKSLYDKFLEWCKSKKVRKIRVKASAKNDLAIKFYEEWI